MSTPTAPSTSTVRAADSSIDPDSDDEADVPVNDDWRFGPGRYWYDFVRLPYTAQHFNYGMTINTDYEPQTEAESDDQFTTAVDTEGSYSLVSQLNWEDEIIWDRKKAKQSVKSILKRPNHASGWIVSSFARTLSEEKSALLQSEPLSCQTYDSAGEANVLITHPPYSIFPIENRELVESIWEEDIIWDAEKMPRIPKPRVLTLDPDDDNVILGIPDDPAESAEDCLEDSTAKSKEAGKRSAKDRKQAKADQTRGLMKKFGLSNETDEEDDSPACPITATSVENPWNISNDKYYDRLATSEAQYKLNTASNRIRHSIPASKLHERLFPPRMGTQRLLSFHRPHLKNYSHGKVANQSFNTVTSLTSTILKKAEERAKELEESGGSDNFFMYTAKDLSATDGDLVLAEMSEQYPPLLSQVGMASCIKNYYKRGPERMIEHDYGENTVSSNPPVIGKLHPGQTLQVIENNMYRAPVYRQSPAETDFIIIRTRNNLYLREFNAIFTVGQQLPLMAVPEPTSREKSNFLRKFLLFHVYRLFRKSRTNPPSISNTELKKMFPHFRSDHITKFAIYQRDTKMWTLDPEFRLPSEEDIQAMVSPEEYCAFFSMQAARERLLEAGYDDKTIPTTGDETEESGQLFMTDEMKAAPWNTTRAFLAAIKGKCFLELNGPADPTGCGEAFSYVRVSKRPKIPPPSRSISKNNKLTSSSRTGSRHVSLARARLMLHKQGLSRDEVNKLNRWDTFNLLRGMSERIAEEKSYGNSSLFTRQTTPAQRQKQYQRECQRIFDLQNSILSSNEILSSDDQSSSDDESEADEFGKFIEDMLLKKKSLCQLEHEKEEVERRELMKMINKQTPSSNPKQAASPGPVARGSASAPQKILNIYRTFRSPSGEEYSRKETVTKADVIETYVKMKETKSQEFIARFVQAADAENKKSKRGRKPKNQPQASNLKTPQVLSNRNDNCSRSPASVTNHPPVISCNAISLSDSSDNENFIPDQSTPNVKSNCDGDTSVVPPKGTPYIKHFADTKITLSFNGSSFGFKRRHRSDSDSDSSSNSDSDSDLEIIPRPSSSSKRCRRDPKVCFKSVLQGIVSSLWSVEGSKVFWYPVNARKFPEYYDTVEKPIDLNSIKYHVLNDHYKSTSQFRQDVNQLVENSRLFNGDDDILTDVAKNMLTVCDEILKEKAAEMAEYEAAMSENVDFDCNLNLTF